MAEGDTKDPLIRQTPDVVVSDPVSGKEVPAAKLPDWVRQGLQIDKDGRYVPESKNKLPL